MVWLPGCIVFRMIWCGSSGETSEHIKEKMQGRVFQLWCSRAVWQPGELWFISLNSSHSQSDPLWALRQGGSWPCGPCTAPALSPLASCCLLAGGVLRCRQHLPWAPTMEVIARMTASSPRYQTTVGLTFRMIWQACS